MEHLEKSNCCSLNCYTKLKKAEITRFTYENMLHDIKTPLTIMYNNIQEIYEFEELPNELKNNLDMFKKYWHKINQMLNDVSDFDKINHGFLKPKLISVDIVPLLKEITISTKPLANKKNINLTFFSNKTSENMTIDLEMLERILINLLSNAYKFTKENGKIKVSLIIGKDLIWLKVKDNGIGISEETIEKLYDRYYFEKSKDNLDGSGLGLSIVREFTKLLNGKIYISTSKNGTEFSISFPIHKTQKQTKINHIDKFYDSNIVQIEL